MLDIFKVFLVDVVSLTRANCTQSMTFYTVLIATLLVFKIIVLAVAVSFTLIERSIHKRRGRSSRVRIVF